MTHSFMYGTAVFEGIRGYWNSEHEQMYLFRLREHYERMLDSMKIMHLETALSRAEAPTHYFRAGVGESQATCLVGKRVRPLG